MKGASQKNSELQNYFQPSNDFFFWIWSLAFWIDKIDLNEKRRERHPFFCPALFSTSFVHRQTRGVDSDYFGEKYKKSPQSLIQVLISDTLNYHFTAKSIENHFYHFQGLSSDCCCFKNSFRKISLQMIKNGLDCL